MKKYLEILEYLKNIENLNILFYLAMQVNYAIVKQNENTIE